MVYKIIGLMSGSSLDGLDIAYVHLQENAGKWEYQFIHTACHPYSAPWRERLAGAPGLTASDYLLLHVEYGHWLGDQVLKFIADHDLAYQVQLIVSHGHTSFHQPARRMTAQLGDGAALAASTGINVVSDLRAMDVALGGQGAPIVPVGEKLLFGGTELFLNLGGIANVSSHGGHAGEALFTAFDVCPANRVLNLLSAEAGRAYDQGGSLAATGRVDRALLERLNALPYYAMGYPKSLDNAFGTDTVYPMIRDAMRGNVADALCTYVEHIAVQVSGAVASLKSGGESRMLVTGGGVHNHFLVDRLRGHLLPLGVTVIVPDAVLADYKEALVMALIGVLRWREENNVLASVTGARRNSIGGAVWMGQEV
ncbi:MAG: anhydro-N-acetylmuramic acid kinase [Bacteroidota bacterium]|nr:anhydro-N-acetylmuramic acid kinase [Bacteroidota bacterium]